MDCFELIEKLNGDYLNTVNSISFKLGSTLCNAFSCFKRRHLKDGYEILKLAAKGVKIRRFSTPKEVPIEKHTTIVPNERVAVYMAVFGGYDQIHEPIASDSQCDYYLITDSSTPGNSIWRGVGEDILSMTKDMEPLVRNRFYKMHPHIIFPEYRYSLYLDGNIEIVGKISECIDYIHPNTGIALHNMSNRDCIYDEEKACALLGKGNRNLIHEQVKRYKNIGFPKHFGMYECPIIARDHQSETCKKLMDEWWNEFLDGGLRDQFSLPVVIWKNGMKFDDIGFLGNNVRLNNKFRVHKH